VPQMNEEESKRPDSYVSSRRKTAPASLPVSITLEEAREFPDHPRVGVGGIVVHEGFVLLVRRGRAPLKNKWSIPGGLVEVGERLEAAVKREVKEETGLDVNPLQIMGIFERIQRDPKPGRPVRYHYVIVDYLCRLRGTQARNSKRPKLRPASDIIEAEWVEGEMLSLYDLSAEAAEVILKAMELVDPGWYSPDEGRAGP
jgi:8-oxo-dGTP diphosphatase